MAESEEDCKSVAAPSPGEGRAASSAEEDRHGTTPLVQAGASQAREGEYV
jgi:hypothetical protein